MYNKGMNFPIPLFQLPVENFCVWEGAFTPEECQSIIDIAEMAEFKAKPGQVGSGPDATTDTEIRDSSIVWLHPTHENDWIHRKYADIAARMNFDKFQLDLDHFDGFQYSKYQVGQHYTWHTDTLQSTEGFRKLSFVLMLSDPSDYEGGELVLSPDGSPKRLINSKVKKGDLIAFYSHIAHQVSPVTSGERLTLVTWALGPKLR